MKVIINQLKRTLCDDCGEDAYCEKVDIYYKCIKCKDHKTLAELQRENG